MWDLLIIGAGPTGCAAAITARRHGLTVMILEASARPRRLPGETLHPGIEPLFAKLGLAEKIAQARFHRHTGIRIGWDAPPHFEPYGEDASGPWRGFQADRQRLATILEHAAVEAGARLRKAVRPASLVLHGSRLRGVATSDGERHLAHLTVDGTGRRAWLARALDVSPELHSPTLRVTFGWTRQEQADGQREPELAARTDGWHWNAPVGGGKCAWVTLRARRPEHDRASPGDGIDVGWRIHRPMAGPGYVLAGDAAVLLDPASSHGVLRAVMSGMLCAEVAAAINSGRSSESAAFSAYRSWMERQFNDDCEKLRALYCRHPSTEFASLFAAGGPKGGRSALAAAKTPALTTG
jgi:flavin-dependent dehydrogenase